MTLTAEERADARMDELMDQADREFERLVEDRMNELRVEHLWSAEGIRWFEGFMECQAAVNAAGALHEALRELAKHPRATDPMSVALRRFAKAAEAFCSDHDEPWIREVAESEVAEDA